MFPIRPLIIIINFIFQIIGRTSIFNDFGCWFIRRIIRWWMMSICILRRDNRWNWWFLTVERCCSSRVSWLDSSSSREMKSVIPNRKNFQLPYLLWSLIARLDFGSFWAGADGGVGNGELAVETISAAFGNVTFDHWKSVSIGFRMRKKLQTSLLIVSVNIRLRCPPTTISPPKTDAIAANGIIVNKQMLLLGSSSP